MKTGLIAFALMASSVPALASLPTETVEITYDGMTHQYYAHRAGTQIAFAVQAMTEDSAEYLHQLRHSANHAQRVVCHTRAQFVHTTAPTLNVFAISCDPLRLSSN
jgi:hypothetical protein